MFNITTDGKYIKHSDGEGSDYWTIVPQKPENILREYSSIKTEDGQNYGRGVIYQDQNRPGLGGIGIAWLLG